MTTHPAEELLRRIPDWSGANCIGVDPELFFRDHTVAKAKEVCVGCPRLEQCLAFATEGDEVGVWAGTTEGERRPGRIYPDCGTSRAYQRHNRHANKPCRDCVDAWNRYRRELRARKRQERRTA